MKLMAHILHGEAQWCENVTFSAAVQKQIPPPILLLSLEQLW